ncbi:MAG: D-alanyl-D-alanine carboxypeptidase/D-alanyl-D-alanine-endopeptidase [Ginsengibacter sp.]
MKVTPIFLLMLFGLPVLAQNIAAKLKNAVRSLEADSQMRHGLTGLYVVNSKTGEVIINQNAETGMATASCLKVITCATAFELLGHDFTYKTILSTSGLIKNDTLNGDAIINGVGDPTFGSWRFTSTHEDSIVSGFNKALNQAGVKAINGLFVVNDNIWDDEVIPGGWPWDDIGSYYGAGARAFNWRENQYDIILKSGNKIGDSVQVVETVPAKIEALQLEIKTTSAEKGSGDNAYIFMPNGNSKTFVRGTIPINESRFTISGSLPNPAQQFIQAFAKQMPLNNIEPHNKKSDTSAGTILYTHNSPPLDSINFYFLRRSINLYGEALLKTIAYKQTGVGATDSGVNVVKRFWKDHNIEETAINIKDGSGLSPANRVTPKALVYVLQFAASRPWYRSFYYALPEINNIKMKSGSIGGVASYAGYVKSKSGTEYTFAIIVNNYNGAGSAIRKKMWAVLDLLK